MTAAQPSRGVPWEAPPLRDILVQCLSNSLTERTILLMLRRYRVGGSGGTQQDRLGCRGEPRVGAADPRDDGGRARPAAGMPQDRIAARVGVSRVTVSHWCRRFLAGRLAGLEDAAGRGRKPSLSSESVRMVLDQAVRPPATLERWSCRS